MRKYVRDVVFWITSTKRVTEAVIVAFQMCLEKVDVWIIEHGFTENIKCHFFADCAVMGPKF